MAGEDFVMVRLTAAGKKIAGNGPLRIARGRREFIFKGDTPIRVEKHYEWNAHLREHCHYKTGENLVELVPAPTAPAELPKIAKPAEVVKA